MSGMVPLEWTSDPISRAMLALYAGASGDHNPVHIDIDFARAAGMPDVFAHGMLGMAYLGRLLTDNFDPRSVRSFGVRFAAIVQVGDQLRCVAETVAAEPGDAAEVRRLALTAINQAGGIVLKGWATIELADATAVAANKE